MNLFFQTINRRALPDLRPVLASLDVFGYPLRADNYSSAELVLRLHPVPKAAVTLELPCALADAAEALVAEIAAAGGRAIAVAADVAESAAVANDTDFGLSAGICTSSHRLTESHDPRVGGSAISVPSKLKCRTAVPGPHK
jgi:hypothetical protein